MQTLELQAISISEVAGDLLAPLAADLADRFHALLAAPDADALREVVTHVRAHYQAAGCFLAEWHGRGEWSPIAACGKQPTSAVKFAMAEMLTAATRADRDRPVLQVRLLDPDGYHICGVLSRPGRYPLLGIVDLGSSRAFDGTEALEALLHVVDGLRSTLVPPDDRDAETVATPAYHVAGRSEAMSALYRMMRIAARSDVPVLVTGETGVGKEHIVRMLHEWSRRAAGPLVAVNCAAIPQELMEAELFGIGRNVASGVSERIGKFTEAEGGTIFLDEIGDLPLPMQAKLLRVIQEREVTPVGQKPQRTNVRVVAATNADLEERVRAGTFRADLYHRLAGAVLRVPPLRERREDIRDLVVHFIRGAARECGKTVRGVTAAAVHCLTAAPWPGNVRELEHTVRWLVYTATDGAAINVESLPSSLREPGRTSGAAAPFDLYDNLRRLEREILERALEHANGNQSRAAILLGISRNGLAQRLRRLGL